MENNRKEKTALNGAGWRLDVYVHTKPSYVRQNISEAPPRKAQTRTLRVCRRWNIKTAFVAVMISVVSLNCLHAQTAEEGVVRHTEKAAESPAVAESADSGGGAASQRTALIEFAMKHQGIPYRSGGSTVKGFDCSGFVWFVYRNALNMDIPRSSRGVWSSDAKTVRLEDALPGDVLVFSAKKGGSGSINHTAILVDKDSIIHAVSSGPKRGVIISPITDGYFAPRLVGVKRFLLDE